MPPQLFLVGPTASGKTAVALEIARRMPVEVISLDSMSVYRGMDIGTAKPTPGERAQVPHHLIDVAEPTEPFSVGKYLLMAKGVAAELDSRGKRVLFVGGAPLYLKALVSGLFDGPSADPAFRSELERRAQSEGTLALHEELRAVDPEAAGKIHPNDLKRIVRALEVFHKTGKPLSRQQTQWPQDVVGQELRIAGLAWDRAELYRRIEQRVDRMFAAGLVEEVRGLLARHGRLGREASQALGYREVLAYLEAGTDLTETVSLVKRNTRRMAKRQLTWFRSFEQIRWFEMTEVSVPANVAEKIARYYEG